MITKMNNILIVGAGAIGASVAAWLSTTTANVYVYDKTETVDKINQQGITTYWGDKPQHKRIAQVAAFDDLQQLPKPDLIIICVKNYSLPAVSQLISRHFGHNTLVMGLQNGIENQTILPQYFNRVIYGVVCYNAWLDEPGVVGYQKKGPLVLGQLISGQLISGQLEDPNKDELNYWQQLLNQGVKTVATDTINDAAHSKLIINLTNSLTTLVALHKTDLGQNQRFQKILSRLTYEGVKTIKAAGFKESKRVEMPSWLLIKSAALLPTFITRKPYRKNLDKMVISSMAQDIFSNVGSSELDTINGYLLTLAKQYQVDTPVNQAVYDLCQQHFARADFDGIEVDEIWQRLAD